ncbi:MAG: FeoB-associated Cys-rich membrane protein [Erysipelotrichaceae bacterium]|nr:FeoB-associated Cys-rich membrane protein [Erysipelotrichaceae bacterium]
MNIYDILLTLLLCAAVALAARHILNEKKAGRTTCGGSCSGCPLSCSERHAPAAAKR